MVSLLIQGKNITSTVYAPAHLVAGSLSVSPQPLRKDAKRKRKFRSNSK